MDEIIFYNQKIITIKKSHTDGDYILLDKNALFKAMKELTHNELKIYLYLNCFEDNETVALSTADIAEKTGANKRKIQMSINTLIEKGYLINTENNNYIFNN